MMDTASPFFMEGSPFLSVATIDGAAVNVIFDGAHQRGDVGDYGVATTQPMLTLPTASVPDEPVGKHVIHGGSDYTIVAHEPDGTGVSALYLEAA